MLNAIFSLQTIFIMIQADCIPSPFLFYTHTRWVNRISRLLPLLVVIECHFVNNLLKFLVTLWLHYVLWAHINFCKEVTTYVLCTYYVLDSRVLLAPFFAGLSCTIEDIKAQFWSCLFCKNLTKNNCYRQNLTPLYSSMHT